jgi:hypothetical protein
MNEVEDVCGIPGTPDTPAENQCRIRDAQHFREKAEVLLRLADGLSLNDLGRFQLTALAEDLRKRARELDAQTTLQPEQSQSENVETNCRE